ncbi:hypothetical protein O181_133069 [Austropuccinia psidii MF-1]|uniref:Uncharacterized protein n=1 Tax=Austropuccinia psidii MF-1 TaxID=1389203 RepID=A0A9Q3L607_9BASI|nr:hypothetical protein [Austropuccinia psidii MF-1]
MSNLALCQASFWEITGNNWRFISDAVGENFSPVNSRSLMDMAGTELCLQFLHPTVSIAFHSKCPLAMDDFNTWNSMYQIIELPFPELIKLYHAFCPPPLHVAAGDFCLQCTRDGDVGSEWQ